MSKEILQNLTTRQILTQVPYCRGCGNQIDSFLGICKCLTKGCKYEGCAQSAKDLDWE